MRDWSGKLLRSLIFSISFDCGVDPDYNNFLWLLGLLDRLTSNSNFFRLEHLCVGSSFLLAIAGNSYPAHMAQVPVYNDAAVLLSSWNRVGSLIFDGDLLNSPTRLHVESQKDVSQWSQVADPPYRTSWIIICSIFVSLHGCLFHSNSKWSEDVRMWLTLCLTIFSRDTYSM